MAGQGKYTKYIPTDPEKSAKYARLGKLFKGSEGLSDGEVSADDQVKANSPFAKHMESGDFEAARAETVARGLEFLQGDVAQGDLSVFPNGINMNYEGTDEISNPNLVEDVKWTKASDPANAFTPDLTSPGPTEFANPLARDQDPEITIADIEGEGYQVGAPGTSTRSPKTTAGPIRSANKLGKFLNLGKNNPNEPSGKF